MRGLGCLKSCLGKVVVAALLMAAALAGWWWGPSVFPELATWFSTGDGVREIAASPELAETTMDRFEALRRGEAGDRLALSSTEIVSIVRYSVPGIIPEGISDPWVEMADGVVTLTARVAVEAFPQLPDLNAVLGFLPDTVEVSLEGALTPLDDERWEALVVHGVRAAFVPLPDRMIPQILEALGREYVGGLPDDAIAIPMPEGLKTAYILRDSLVLVSDR